MGGGGGGQAGGETFEPRWETDLSISSRPVHFRSNGAISHLGDAGVTTDGGVGGGGVGGGMVPGGRLDGFNRLKMMKLQRSELRVRNDGGVPSLSIVS